jgi:hypothetical protein
MVTALYPLVVTTCFLSAGQTLTTEGSYLFQPAYCLDEQLRGPAEPYCPQPGDIVLSTDRKLFWRIMFRLAFTDHPHHSGIIFAKPDGSLGLLEAGPHDTFYCHVLDVLPHLHSYDIEGPVWIRRRRTPLTPEQSAKLTEWAMAQDGKRFALIRLGGQLTPFRSRGPLRTWVVGGPHGDRRSYFCCELVMESCVVAGLLDPTTTRPAATYPRDVFFDQSINPYINKHLNMSPGWYPPARWTSHPGEPGAFKVNATVPAPPAQ